jgi:argininosuccinate synthase
MLVLTSPIEKAPNKPAYVEVDFKEGTPVGLNGKRMDGVEIIATLNALGGKHGVGQVDLVENRLVGMKSRGVYETPGGTILYEARKALEGICLDRDTLHYKEIVSHRYAELVYYGQWYSPLRVSLDAFFKQVNKPLTGTVRVKLYKGNCRAVGSKSPRSLFVPALASFTMGAEYDPADANGFIRLFGLPMKVNGIVQRQVGRGPKTRSPRRKK